MKKPSPLYQLISAALLGAMLAPGASGAAGPDALSAETARFLTLFPASEMQSLERRMSVHIAAGMSSKMRPDYLACLDTAFLPGVFDDASLSVATKTFQDPQSLKELNEFLQSEAGTRFRRNAVTGMTASLKKVQAGEPLGQPAPPAYSAADMRAFQAFSMRPAYALLNRFNEALAEQYRTNDSGNKKVWDIHMRCSVETDSTRGPTNKVPVQVK